MKTSNPFVPYSQIIFVISMCLASVSLFFPFDSLIADWPVCSQGNPKEKREKEKEKKIKK